MNKRHRQIDWSFRPGVAEIIGLVQGFRCFRELTTQHGPHRVPHAEASRSDEK
jgi:hypothetical protein